MASDEGNVSDVETSKESNEEKENDICSEYFVELLEKHGQPLLSKSRVPIAKREKNIALDTMSKVISKQKGIAYTSTQILAKFSKMKTRTKQKADVNRTGNRKIVLSEIEKRFWEFLSGYDNPALNKLPFAAVAGLKQPDCQAPSSQREFDSVSSTKIAESVYDSQTLSEFDPSFESCSFENTAAEIDSCVQFATAARTRQNGYAFESEGSETENLSNEQLQRFVLIQQLDILKLQRELFQEQRELINEQKKTSSLFK